VHIQKGMFELALTTFDEAQNTISSGLTVLKIEPFIYRAMTFIEKVKAAHAQPSKSVSFTLPRTSCKPYKRYSEH
jgi:hypothetical protein